MFARVLTVLALAVVSVVAVAASSATGSSTAATARPLVVYDAIGDTAGVADITSVAVARDAADRLTFALNVAGHPAMKRGDLFSIGIDADRNLATGTHGRDLVIMLGWPKGDAQPTYWVGTWGGSEWEQLDALVEAAYSGSGPRFVVAMDEIGVGRSFRFDARAERLSAPNRNAVDRAPGKGLATAAIGVPATIAEIGRVWIPGTMLAPEAGKVLRVRGIELAADDTRVDVAPGLGASVMVRPDRVRCSAKIGSTMLRPVGSCAWRVPGTARGKSLMLKVSVAYRGDEVTDVYPLEVE